MERREKPSVKSDREPSAGSTSRPFGHRRSIRLSGYDYSQAGMYVFTVVVDNRLPLLGRIIDGELDPTAAGKLAAAAWEALPDRFPTIVVDEFVVMPNHVHGIVFLGANPVGEPPPTMEQASHLPDPDRFRAGAADSRPRIPNQLRRERFLPQLGEVIRSFKGASAREIRTTCLPEFGWQRNYWERIIRGDHELERFRKYIYENPARWAMDKHFVEDAIDHRQRFHE
jgi:REP-associated tyrosine transposase